MGLAVKINDFKAEQLKNTAPDLYKGKRIVIFFKIFIAYYIQTRYEGFTVACD